MKTVLCFGDSLTWGYDAAGNFIPICLTPTATITTNLGGCTV